MTDELTFRLTRRPQGLTVTFIRDGRETTVAENLSHESTAFGMVVEGLRRLAGTDRYADARVIDLPDGAYREWRDRPRKPNIPGSWPRHEVVG